MITLRKLSTPNNTTTAKILSSSQPAVVNRRMIPSLGVKTGPPHEQTTQTCANSSVNHYCTVVYKGPQLRHSSHTGVGATRPATGAVVFAASDETKKDCLFRCVMSPKPNASRGGCGGSSSTTMTDSGGDGGYGGSSWYKEDYDYLSPDMTVISARPHWIMNGTTHHSYWDAPLGAPTAAHDSFSDPTSYSATGMMMIGANGRMVEYDYGVE